MQDEWADLDTCKQRREKWLPTHIRQLYAALAGCTDENQRRNLQRLAWNARKEWILECCSKVLTDKVRRGGVPNRSKKLFDILGVVMPSSAISHSAIEWGSEVHRQFAGKWGCHDLQGRMNILDVVLRHEGDGFPVQCEDLMEAFRTIKRKSRTDHYGVSVFAFMIIAQASPGLVEDFLQKAIASTSIMSSIVLRGRVYGKESSIAPASSMRAILPQPAVMQVLDVLLPMAVSGLISEVLPPQRDCFIGALPKTQCLDVAHGLQCIIEKGLDEHGSAALAQSDIEKYYDSLPVLAIMRWLVQKGLHPGTAACLVRHQMCPHVLLACGSSEVAIKGRSIGGLTGSRIAGLLGRIPVESIVAERRGHWRQWAYEAGGDFFCLCTWVDNLFSASASLHGAINILEDFEHQLQSKWRMKIKPTSRACMRARGSTEQPTDSVKWPLCDKFCVLGHLLQDDGSIRSCWSRARVSMWRAFWANPASKEMTHSTLNDRINLLTKTVTPQLDFRCSRWPPQKQVADELNRTQRKMTAILLKTPRFPGEPIEAFVRRRGRISARMCKEHGLWSARWFSRATRWDSHLSRDRNIMSWAARLRDFKDRDWFMQRRIELAPQNGWSSSVHAGRTSTRSYHGYVHTRWHDGIHYALTTQP